MKTLLFALLTLPFLSGAAVASTEYRFTYHTVHGPIGFTFVSPQPLTAPSTYVNPWIMAGCETTGAPGWFCLDAYIRQTTVNGMPIVQVVLEIIDLANPGDAFSTDQLMGSFAGASLSSTGNYTGFLDPTTLTISQSVASSTNPDTPQLRPSGRQTAKQHTISNGQPVLLPMESR